MNLFVDDLACKLFKWMLDWNIKTEKLISGQSWKFFFVHYRHIVSSLFDYFCLSFFFKVNQETLIYTVLQFKDHDTFKRAIENSGKRIENRNILNIFV